MTAPPTSWTNAPGHRLDVRPSHAWALHRSGCDTRRRRVRLRPQVPDCARGLRPEPVRGPRRFEFLDYGVGLRTTPATPRGTRRGHYSTSRAGRRRTARHAARLSKFGAEAMQFLPLPLHGTGCSARARRPHRRPQRARRGRADLRPNARRQPPVRGYQTFRFTDHDALYQPRVSLPGLGPRSSGAAWDRRRRVLGLRHGGAQPRGRAPTRLRSSGGSASAW